MGKDAPVSCLVMLVCIDDIIIMYMIFVIHISLLMQASVMVYKNNYCVVSQMYVTLSNYIITSIYNAIHISTYPMLVLYACGCQVVSIIRIRCTDVYQPMAYRTPTNWEVT